MVGRPLDVQPYRPTGIFGSAHVNQLGTDNLVGEDEFPRRVLVTYCPYAAVSLVVAVRQANCWFFRQLHRVLDVPFVLTGDTLGGTVALEGFASRRAVHPEGVHLLLSKLLLGSLGGIAGVTRTDVVDHLVAVGGETQGEQLVLPQRLTDACAFGLEGVAVHRALAEYPSAGLGRYRRDRPRGQVAVVHGVTSWWEAGVGGFLHHPDHSTDVVQSVVVILSGRFVDVAGFGVGGVFVVH